MHLWARHLFFSLTLLQHACSDAVSSALYVSWSCQIKQLNIERSELEQQVDSLKAKCEEIETKEAQRRASEEEKHAEEVRAARGARRCCWCLGVRVISAVAVVIVFALVAKTVTACVYV